MSMPVDRWPQGPILVTGATGYVGGRLTRWLLQAGIAVRAYARAPENASANALRKAGAEIVEGDVRDQAALEKAAKGCVGLVHAAACTHRNWGPKATVDSVNVEAPTIVWRAASAAGVERMVHVSTTGVLGPLRAWPAPEDDPMRPNSRYRRSKAAGEVKLRHVSAAESGCHLVIARIASVVGPGAKGWAAIRNDVVNGRIRLLGHGMRPLHLVDVDDACQGILRCLTHAVPHGRVYHLAGAELSCFREIVETLARLEGVTPQIEQWPWWPLAPLARFLSRVGGAIGYEPKLLHSVEFMASARAYDLSRAYAELSYSPMFSTAASIERFRNGADALPNGSA